MPSAAAIVDYRGRPGVAQNAGTAPFAVRVLAAVVIAVFVRCLAARFPYSGMNKPPLLGDFEAQRHWMELTVHVPPQEWYTYKTEYWGLDYPPLSAYFARFLGPLCAFFVGPESVALEESRGFESAALTLFMRLTVIISDVLFLFPSVIAFLGHKASIRSMVLVLLLPALVCVDHGHFQYNGVALSMVVAAAFFMYRGKDNIAACLYTMSFLFKQTMLYYAIAFFAIMLHRCLQYNSRLQFSVDIVRLFGLGMAVGSVIMVAVYPVFNSENPFAVLRRVFPVGRGLFEDKVSNFWCATSPILKLRQIFSNNVLVMLSAATTVLASVPLLAYALPLKTKNAKSSLAQRDSSSSSSTARADERRSPFFTRILICKMLAFASFGFFLFSFMVHEKAIMQAMLPLVMAHVIDIDEASGGSLSWHVVAAVNASSFSLLYLFSKEESHVLLFSLTVLWNIVATPKLRHVVLHILPYGILSAVYFAFPSPWPRFPHLHIMCQMIVCFCVFFLTYLHLGYDLVMHLLGTKK